MVVAGTSSWAIGRNNETLSYGLKLAEACKGVRALAILSMLHRTLVGG